MSNGFDAYHKWLSIPPHEQPPNHYRLLGLELFESDPDVISAAADRQMAHVQTYKTGPHSALSQQLLNEISAAKLCLLRPQKKAAYDQQLRQQQPAAPAALPTMATPAAARPAYSGMSVTPPPPTIPPPATVIAPPVHSQTIATGTLLLIASSVMTILLLVGIVVLLANRRPNTPAAPTVGPEPTQAQRTVVQSETEKTDIAHATSHESPAEKEIEKRSDRIVPKPAAALTSKPLQAPASASTTTNQLVVKSPSQPTIPVPPPAENKVSPAIAATSSPKQLPATVGLPAGGSAPPATPAPGAALAGTTAVPDRATLDALDRQLPNPADAKPAEILDQAHKATAAPQAYVLLRRSLDRAVEQGDALTAISAADELTRRFAVDGVQLRWQTLDDLQAHAKLPDSWNAIAGAAAAMLDDPAVAVQADLVQRLSELSIVAARRSGNLDTIRKVTLWILRLRSATSPLSGPTTSS